MKNLPVTTGGFFNYLIKIMFLKSNLIKIGSIAKPHGVAGGVIVRLLPGIRYRFPSNGFIFVEIGGGLVPYEIRDMRVKSNTDILLVLDKINSEPLARGIKDRDVFLDPAKLEVNTPEDEMGLHSLIGFEVVDKKHGFLGLVKEVLEYHKNPLLQLDLEGKEILIPFNEDFIQGFDAERRILEIAAPEGLIDLYLG